MSGPLLIAIGIVLNVCIIVIFKLYKKYNVDNLSAIIVNYFVCYMTAWVVMGRFPFDSGMLGKPWVIFALFLGGLFVIIFNLVALTTQKLGIAKTVVYQKMSMIAPVIIGIAIFMEQLNAFKVLGILFSVAAIFLLSGFKWKDKDVVKTRGTAELYGIATFFGSCIIDGMLYLLEKLDIVNNADIQFVAHLFLFAGIFGLIFLFLRITLKRKVSFGIKEILGGIILGIPNFFTVYIILKVLDMGWEGSIFFPINNVGILALAAIVGVFIFKEKLKRQSVIGLVLAIIAIYLLN